MVKSLELKIRGLKFQPPSHGVGGDWVAVKTKCKIRLVDKTIYPKVFKFDHIVLAY